MKRFLTTTTAILALTIGANAADLPPSNNSYVPAPVVNSYSLWSGFYAGAHLGWTNAQFDSKRFSDGLSTGIDDDNSVSGGLFLGYNWDLQNSPLVLGVEGDISFYDLSASEAFLTTNTFSAETTFGGSLRARLGFDAGRFMPYLTAGVALGNLENEYVTAASIASDDSTQWGWVAGLGVDYAWTENLFVRLEYLYTDLQEDTYNLTADDFKSDVDLHTVRIGVGFKF